MSISLLILSSVDLLICGASYGTAGRKVPLIGVLMMSAISAIMFSIAFTIGDISLNEIDIIFARGIGKALFIILGLWIAFTAILEPFEARTNNSLLELFLLGSAASVDSFIIGATLSIFSGSRLWSLYLFLIGMCFFITGQTIGLLASNPQRTRIASVFQGFFFVFWGLFA